MDFREDRSRSQPELVGVRSLSEAVKGPKPFVLVRWKVVLADAEQPVSWHGNSVHLRHCITQSTDGAFGVVVLLFEFDDNPAMLIQVLLPLLLL
jgi:hypothetical protein